MYFAWVLVLTKHILWNVIGSIFHPIPQVSEGKISTVKVIKSNKVLGIIKSNKGMRLIKLSQYIQL